MKISLNELQSVCRKAFMGMGFTAGHADDASAMVAWMSAMAISWENLAPRAAAGSAPPAANDGTRKPPSRHVILPPESGWLLAPPPVCNGGPLPAATGRCDQ